jgi:hypothetical protein
MAKVSASLSRTAILNTSLLFTEGDQQIDKRMKYLNFAPDYVGISIRNIDDVGLI